MEPSVSRRGALAVVLVLCAGCSGAQRPTKELRPLEERRARALIEEAMLDNGVRPARPRQLTLRSGQPFSEDMAIEGSRYGVAYVTVPEAEKVSGSIPAYNPDSQELKLVRGQSGEVVLVLYEQNYRYDAGATHSTNAVTAERTLKRDVTDYLLHVVKPDKVK